MWRKSYRMYAQHMHKFRPCLQKRMDVRIKIKMRKMHTCFGGIRRTVTFGQHFLMLQCTSHMKHENHSEWKGKSVSKLPVLRSKIMALTICLHLHFQGSCCGLWPATSAPMMRMVWRGAGEVGRCWKVPRKFSVSSGVDEDPMRRGISPARSFPCPGVSEAAAMVPGGQTGGGYCYQAGI